MKGVEGGTAELAKSRGWVEGCEAVGHTCEAQRRGNRKSGSMGCAKSWHHWGGGEGPRTTLRSVLRGTGRVGREGGGGTTTFRPRMESGTHENNRKGGGDDESAAVQPTPEGGGETKDRDRKPTRDKEE